MSAPPESPLYSSQGVDDWVNNYPEDVWSSTDEANAAKKLKLPPTKTLRTAEMYKSAQASQTMTYLKYETTLRSYIHEVKPWPEFQRIAEAAKNRWKNYIRERGVREEFGYQFKDALRELHAGVDVQIEADVADVTKHVLNAAAIACRDLTNRRLRVSTLRRKEFSRPGQVERLPDEIRYEMDSCVDNGYRRTVLYFELKRALKSFTIGAIPQSDFSGGAVAKCFSSSFLYLSDKDEKRHRPYRAMMCQLLFGMLYTDTRCATLTNHNETIFVRGVKDERDRLILYMSDVYTCDGSNNRGELTSLHGMLGVLLNFVDWKEQNWIDRAFAIQVITGHRSSESKKTGAASSSRSASKIRQADSEAEKKRITAKHTESEREKSAVKARVGLSGAARTTASLQERGNQREPTRDHKPDHQKPTTSSIGERTKHTTPLSSSDAHGSRSSKRTKEGESSSSQDTSKRRNADTQGSHASSAVADSHRKRNRSENEQHPSKLARTRELSSKTSKSSKP